MLLTDRQALQLIRDMRDNTQSTAVAALCDWALTLAQRQGRRLPRRLLAPRPGRIGGGFICAILCAASARQRVQILAGAEAQADK